MDLQDTQAWLGLNITCGIPTFCPDGWNLSGMPFANAEYHLLAHCTWSPDDTHGFAWFVMLMPHCFLFNLKIAPCYSNGNNWQWLLSSMQLSKNYWSCLLLMLSFALNQIFVSSRLARWSWNGRLAVNIFETQTTTLEKLCSGIKFLCEALEVDSGILWETPIAHIVAKDEDVANCRKPIMKQMAAAMMQKECKA